MPGVNGRHDKFREWLREHLDASPRGTRSALAKYLGLSRPDAITRMLNTDPHKETREIKAAEFEQMRRFFGEPSNAVDEFSSTGSIDGLAGPVALSPAKRLPYGGVVSAGGFVASDAYFDQDGGNVEVPSSIVRHPSFQDVAQFAWCVRGTSMDLAGIQDGMWVVAVPYLEYLARHGDLHNGQPVIVERTRFGGAEIERTIKEVQFTRNGMRLVPRSSNPTHKELFIPLDHSADGDAETVTILAVVLSAVRDYTST